MCPVSKAGSKVAPSMCPVSKSGGKVVPSMCPVSKAGGNVASSMCPFSKAGSKVVPSMCPVSKAGSNVRLRCDTFRNDLEIAALQFRWPGDELQIVTLRFLARRAHSKFESHPCLRNFNVTICTSLPRPRNFNVTICVLVARVAGSIKRVAIVTLIRRQSRLRGELGEPG